MTVTPFLRMDLFISNKMTSIFKIRKTDFKYRDHKLIYQDDNYSTRFSTIGAWVLIPALIITVVVSVTKSIAEVIIW